jgi:predicted NAD-dependent protein-ADP-ribosyltransferase YbiA (DUF1768 family)
MLKRLSTWRSIDECRKMSASRIREAVALLLLSGLIVVAGSCVEPESSGGEVPLVQGTAVESRAAEASLERDHFPDHWWKPVPAADGAWWEVLPQAADPGEVILSKRNELGVLSNFAATPFVFRGKKYASLEGLWQSLKYPESPDDPRAQGVNVSWNHSRDEVAAMVAFEAKEAGDQAGENMQVLGIDWVTFEGERIRYRGPGQGRYYRIIEAATRAKLKQNPEVERVLLATGDLVLRPDHVREENAGAAWRYEEIWMKLRAELQAELGGAAEEG